MGKATLARADLRLDRLWVAYPGTARSALEDWAEAVPVAALMDELRRRPTRA